MRVYPFCDETLATLYPRIPHVRLREFLVEALRQCVYFYAN